MRYLLCNCNNMNIILYTLNEQGYILKDVHTSIFLLLSGQPYKILIDQKEKVYYVFSQGSDINSIVGDSKITVFDNENVILNELGIKDANKQKSALYDESLSKLNDKILSLFNLVKPSSLDLFAEQFNKISDKEKEDINFNPINDFKSEFLPGRIVLLEINGQRYFGFILSSNTIVYVNNKGQIIGYLNGCLSKYEINSPYNKIKQILIPTATCYQLKDYAKMQVAWSKVEKKVTIKKTISEIEKELGLTPGTLEIC